MLTAVAVLGTTLLVVALSVAIVGVFVVGVRMYDRMMEGSSIWKRLPWLLPLLAVLMVMFVLVVEWRCALGLIDEDECIVHL